MRGQHLFVWPSDWIIWSDGQASSCPQTQSITVKFYIIVLLIWCGIETLFLSIIFPLSLAMFQSIILISHNPLGRFQGLILISHNSLGLVFGLIPISHILMTMFQILFWIFAIFWQLFQRFFFYWFSMFLEFYFVKLYMLFLILLSHHTWL